MRDKTTGQHAAAVARYAKALAIEMGCDEAEQDMVHTAGLLHDIGKFTWPDRVLHADVVTDEDLAIVQHHPQEGATLVGALDGYGPVADAILYHHERVDGGGYPAGLIGNEIPLASRILAICSTYDTMTAQDTLPLADDARGSDGRAAQRAPGTASSTASSSRRFIALLEREGRDVCSGRRLRDRARIRAAGAQDGRAALSRPRNAPDALPLDLLTHPRPSVPRLMTTALQRR